MTPPAPAAAAAHPHPAPPARAAFRHPDPNGGQPGALGALGPWACNANARCTAEAVVQWASAPDADGNTVPVFACAVHAPA